MAQTDQTTGQAYSQDGSDDALWRQFGAATSTESFCRPWLALQCDTVKGALAGVVLLGAPDEGRAFAPAAFWPEKKLSFQELADVAQRALTERRGLVIKRQQNDDVPAGYDLASV